MKQESGKGTTKLIFIICLILLVVFFLAKYVTGILKKEQVKNLQADLLLVQAKVEGVKGKNILNSEENPLKGVKLSEITEEFDIAEFIDKGIIPGEEYEKYYILNANNLNEMDLHKLVNKYDGYFIVNYENFEVIYTLGYENENGLWCYKLSEISKMPEIKNVIPVISKPVNDTDSNEEVSTEAEKENTEENNQENAEESNQDNADTNSGETIEEQTETN